MSRNYVGDESRTSPRFVPDANLSMLLAGRSASMVQGDVRNLSEVGACVLTKAPVENGADLTVDVRDGYSFLFRAAARIVWRSGAERPSQSFDCAHGVLFTDLSSFSRKLILRLGGLPNRIERPWDAYVDTDPDLEVLFRRNGSSAKPEGEKFDLLSDPSIEAQLFGARVENEAHRRETSRDAALSGNLEHFNGTDVLQMLEGSRATGVLRIEGECEGEIHLRNGRICGCFARGRTDEKTLFNLIAADRGRFRFTPARVRSNVATRRTTTQLVLESQLRRDKKR